jgi:hypothetical protein
VVLNHFLVVVQNHFPVEVQKYFTIVALNNFPAVVQILSHQEALGQEHHLTEATVEMKSFVPAAKSTDFQRKISLVTTKTVTMTWMPHVTPHVEISAAAWNHPLRMRDMYVTMKVVSTKIISKLMSPA